MKLIVSVPSGFRFSQQHMKKLKAAADLDIVVAPNAEITKKEIASADVLFCNMTNFDPSWLDNAPNLKWIHTLSAGVDKFLPAIKGRSIMLTNSRGVHGINIAEHVLMMMLMHERRVMHAVSAQMRREWSLPWYHENTPGELFGKTVIVFGLGKIGERLAEVCTALGMDVLGVKTSPSPVDHVSRVYAIDEMHAVLPLADYVIVALPHTPATDRLFGREAFNLMKKSAFFVNIGRGKIVDEQALIEALQAREIAGAGLDVFETEPLPKESPLWSMENVIITPHNAGLTPHYMDRVVDILCENLKAYVEGKPLPTLVDPEKGY